MGLFHATTIRPEDFSERHGHALIEGEEVLFAFRTLRDFIAFTDWRVLHVDVRGISGRRRQYLTVPYRAINAFMIESAGMLDLGAKARIHLSGHPPISFHIGRNTDTAALQSLLAEMLGA